MHVAPVVFGLVRAANVTGTQLPLGTGSGSAAGRPKPATPALKESDLQRWRLGEAFPRELGEAVRARGGPDPAGTWADPRRQLALGDYLGLHLFGLLNPVVKTLRGRAAASHLERVQAEVCAAAVSLGSLSEAQAVVDPGLLAAVFARLQARGPGE